MKLGYRLFDLAREYNNEKTFADVVRLSEHDASLPSRDQLFIASKVWPTDLGVKPTSAAIETSLEHLNSNYVDQYLLHWPV
jgi:diketogulonate reductase-like aldo/keto reductase